MAAKQAVKTMNATAPNNADKKPSRAERRSMPVCLVVICYSPARVIYSPRVYVCSRTGLMTSSDRISPVYKNLSLEGNKQMAIKVIRSRCPQNHACPSIRFCPAGALRQNGYDAPVVDEEKCTGCGACVRVCPMKALQK